VRGKDKYRGFSPSFSFLFGRKEKRKKQREKKSLTKTLLLKERLSLHEFLATP
jgi:hypothetical protein